MKKVYVASGLKNYAAVLDAQKWFVERGVVPAFDWANEYANEVNGVRPKVSISNDKQRLANAMLRGVRECDAFLLMMPAKRGAHVEFGIAVALGKPVVVFNQNEADDICFYLLPCVKLVTRNLVEAKRQVVDLLDGV